MEKLERKNNVRRLGIIDKVILDYPINIFTSCKPPRAKEVKCESYDGYADIGLNNGELKCFIIIDDGYDFNNLSDCLMNKNDIILINKTIYNGRCYEIQTGENYILCILREK